MCPVCGPVKDVLPPLSVEDMKKIKEGFNKEIETMKIGVTSSTIIGDQESEEKEEGNQVVKKDVVEDKSSDGHSPEVGDTGNTQQGYREPGVVNRDRPSLVRATPSGVISTSSTNTPVPRKNKKDSILYMILLLLVSLIMFILYRKVARAMKLPYF